MAVPYSRCFGIEGTDFQRFSGSTRYSPFREFSIAKAQRAVRVSSRSRSSVYAAFIDSAQFCGSRKCHDVRERRGIERNCEAMSEADHGWAGLTLVVFLPLHRSRQSTKTPPPAPAPISSHFVFMPLAAAPGRRGGPQTAVSSRVACSPSCTVADCDGVLSFDAFCSAPPG